MGSVPAPAPAREAASVILVRDGATGLETLLVERHPRSRFAPGALAFPGGRVEAEDAAPGWAGLCHGLTADAAARRLGDVALPERALAYWIAALREAFEEVGILLAYDRSGAPCPGGDPTWRARLRPARRAAAGAPASFRALVSGEGLRLGTDRLAYYAHWITPEERPLRYDARFFVAAAFPGAEAEPDGVEAVAARWLTPAAALDGHGAGALTLPFPTRAILRTLAEAPDVPGLVAAASGRVVRAVRPRVVRVGDEERILLPGDAGYH